MDNETITIDLEALKNDLRDDCMGTFYGGGFGGALMEAFDIDSASPEELIKQAQNNGIDLRKYCIHD